MARLRTATGVAALLACLSALAACERYPAPSPASDATAVTETTSTETTSSETTSSDTTSAETTVPTSTAEPPSTSTGSGTTGKGTGGKGSSSSQTGGAVGSPIDVPTIPDPHTSMDGLRPAIEGAFVAACGGDTLCVHLVYTHGACLLGYEPSHRAARGSTVKVLTESQQECDAANGVTPEPTTEPTTGTDETTPVATNQPAPDAT